jgi:hypothetical protein
MINDDSGGAFREHIRAGGMAVEVPAGYRYEDIARRDFSGIVGYLSDITVCNAGAPIFVKYIEQAHRDYLPSVD